MDLCGLLVGVLDFEGGVEFRGDDFVEGYSCFFLFWERYKVVVIVY